MSTQMVVGTVWIALGVAAAIYVWWRWLSKEDTVTLMDLVMLLLLLLYGPIGWVPLLYYTGGDVVLWRRRK